MIGLTLSNEHPSGTSLFMHAFVALTSYCSNLLAAEPNGCSDATVSSLGEQSEESDSESDVDSEGGGRSLRRTFAFTIDDPSTFKRARVRISNVDLAHRRAYLQNVSNSQRQVPPLQRTYAFTIDAPSTFRRARIHISNSLLASRRAYLRSIVNAFGHHPYIPSPSPPSLPVYTINPGSGHTVLASGPPVPAAAAASSSSTASTATTTDQPPPYSPDPNPTVDGAAPGASGSSQAPPIGQPEEQPASELASETTQAAAEDPLHSDPSISTSGPSSDDEDVVMSDADDSTAHTSTVPIAVIREEVQSLSQNHHQQSEQPVAGPSRQPQAEAPPASTTRKRSRSRSADDASDSSEAEAAGVSPKRRRTVSPVPPSSHVLLRAEAANKNGSTSAAASSTSSASPAENSRSTSRRSRRRRRVNRAPSAEVHNSAPKDAAEFY